MSSYAPEHNTKPASEPSPSPSSSPHPKSSTEPLPSLDPEPKPAPKTASEPKPSPDPKPKPSPDPSRTRIFGEYIGFKNQLTRLTDVPNTKTLPFQFILAFATDYDEDGKPTNGAFKLRWVQDLTAPILFAYKTSHPNTKFILSIGCYDDTFPFRPLNNLWTMNAVSSIKDIINQYNFDSVDIHYCATYDTVTAKTFANFVGDLITELKHSYVIEIASIAPIPTLDTHYSQLYTHNKNYIDFVNYLLNAVRDSLDSWGDFIKAGIENAQKNYPNAKLIIGNKTNVHDRRRVPDDVFFETYRDMREQLSGTFAWCADDSPSHFPFESLAQKELAG